MKRIALGCVLCITAATGWAQKAYTVNYTAAPVTVDGVVEPLWGSGSILGGGDFVDHSTGAPAPEQTFFRAMWDSTNLYVLMIAQDTAASFDPNLTGNDQALTFTKDDLELFLDPISSRNAEPNPSHKYQIVFYPNTDGAGLPINAPAAFLWSGAGVAEFPGPGSWTNTAGIVVTMTVGGITTPNQYLVETKIPWTSFDVAAVNTDPVNLPPVNNDVWSAQPCRSDNSGAFTKWNPSAAGFRTKPWGLWTFTGAPAQIGDWQLYD